MSFSRKEDFLSWAFCFCFGFLAPQKPAKEARVGETSGIAVFGPKLVISLRVLSILSYQHISVCVYLSVRAHSESGVGTKDFFEFQICFSTNDRMFLL